MGKFFAVLFLLATLSLGACGDDGIGFACDGAGNCSEPRACCKAGGDCYYEANGKKFDCNGANCAQAAQELAQFCGGGDVVDVDLSGIDLSGIELPDIAFP